MNFRPEILARYAPLLTVLLAYFVLTVLMNIVFVVFDDRFASTSLGAFSISAFPIHTPGYWILLLLPFLIVPPIAICASRMLESRITTFAEWVPEFRLLDYLAITGVCYAIVVNAMYRADAWRLLWSGHDAVSSVWARFELLDNLWFFERVTLQSLLVFLTLYSVMRAYRTRERVWTLLFVANLIAMITLLVLLNMKWPVIVLMGGVVACTVMFARHKIISTCVATAGMLLLYLVVATVVLRLPPPPTAPRDAPKIETAAKDRPGPEPTAISPAKPPAQDTPQASVTPAPEATSKPSTGPGAEQAGSPQVRRTPGEGAAPTVEGTVKAASSWSSYLAVSGLIRMALPYPFYYRTFSEEGHVCGTIFDRVMRRHNPCQPSLLVYERMFKDDGFAGRGTAPAAFNITGYALDGWFGAIVETVLAGIVIGAFMAVPPTASAISGTALVMGVLTAYFFSQLPFEGAIIYDHGLLWWLLLVICYAALRHLFSLIRRRA
jgi:hypothetical protein